VQAEDLSKMVPDLKLKPIAFQLQVPDDVIRERSKTTGRQSDNRQILEQRIKNYHREMDAISFYFPGANIVLVDANRPEAEVWKAIQTALDGAGSSAFESSRSVYLLEQGGAASATLSAALKLYPAIYHHVAQVIWVVSDIDPRGGLLAAP
jgi:hypothetical protein